MSLKKIFLKTSLFLGSILLITSGCINTTNITELWLVRHGQTDWNVQKRNMGQQNIPLNATGIEQANLTADFLLTKHKLNPFAAIYSSDLSRTHQTAQAIGTKLDLTIHDDQRLRETKGGIFEGYTPQEFEQKFPEITKKIRKDPTFVIPGAETKEQVITRIMQALQEIVQKYSGQRIIIVTHGGCLNKISRWIKNNFPQKAPLHSDPENCSINIISITHDLWKIDSWNQIEHLKRIIDEKKEISNTQIY